MTRLVLLALIGIVIGTAPAHAGESLSVSPAVVPLGGKTGQSTRQKLTIVNSTKIKMSFTLEARDVTVRNGKRGFLAAGELPGSVAATAVFSKPTLDLAPGEQQSVDVTLTLPPNMQQRAMLVVFRGTTLLANRSTASIATLLTFEVSGNISVNAGEVIATAPTATTNAKVAVPVTNDGTEPAIVRAAAVLLAPSGAMRGKLSFDAQRLLPGEQAQVASEFHGDLSPGTYRVVTTFEVGKRSFTRMGSLVVP